jgi:two-component system response regulator YesN
MFKLLIADDEQLEREALRFIISKSIDSISDIEEAVNGRDAIVKAQSTNPDIIILDINMPGINGIEAAWKIRERDPSVCIVFLTAFHQFDYAHEAIKLGVEDYIVKPSSEQRIIEVIEKATARLLEKKVTRQKRENLELKLDKATDYLSSEFIYNLAKGHMAEDKFRNYLTLLDIELHKGRGMIMKIDYKSYPILTSSEYQKQILKKRCFRLIMGHLKQHDLYCATNLDLNNALILIFSDRQNETIESETVMRDTLESLSAVIRENLNIDVILGVGPLFDRAPDACSSFTGAKNNISRTVDRTDLSAPEERFPVALEMDLEQAVLGVEKEQLERQFQKLEEWVHSSPGSFEKKKQRMIDLSVILRHSASIQFPEGDLRINSADLSDSATEMELLTAFRMLLTEFMDRIAVLYARENIPMVKKACDYIAANYHRDITLEETADYCNLSTFYFSKIFKKHKKKNFITYLTELRIEEAKRLLQETDLTMKEISARIGYRDPNYFTRVFKRVENSSPRDFRNKKVLKQQKLKDS